MFDFYIAITIAVLDLFFIGGVIGFLIGKYLKKK